MFVSFDTSSVTVFLERQAVSYSFSVTPTTIQETYEIHIEADFETDVPIPVITMIPTEINLEPLESGEIDSFRLTVENHGLPRGDNGNFEFPEHDFLEFDLGELNSIGDIEPKSSVTVRVHVNINEAKKKRAAIATIITSIYVLNLAYSYVCGDLQTRLAKVFLKKETYTETEVPEIIIVDPPPPPMPPPCYTCVVDPEPSIITIPVPGIFGPPSTYTIGYEASTPSFCNDCLQSIFDCVPAPKFPGSDCIPFLLRGEIAINDLQSSLDWLACGLSLPWPSAAPNVQDSSQSTVSGGSKALNQLRKIKKFLPFAQCGYELYLNCFSSESDVSDDIEALIESMYPIHLSIATAVEVFGDSDWMSVEDSAWLSDVLRPTMSDYSDLGAMISEEEFELIINNPAPMRVTEDGEMEMSMEKVITFIQRLNNTISGWNEGFLEPSDGHTNLASYSAVTDMFDEIENYNETAKARGFSSYVDAYNNAANEINQFDNWEDEAGVCTVVKISIGQQLSLTREAFNAKLEIENMESSELTNIHVDITIHRSPTGKESSHLFSIGEATLSGAVTDSGDYWSLPSNGAGAIEWLLVAYDEAAPTNENKAYYDGGRLQCVLAGNNISVPLLPTRITITPNPSLVIHNFLEKEVISDDPFTEPVEPAVPFVLAVAVTNNGSGVAMNVQISSAQPRIVNNEKGLLAEFQIIGSRMACDEINPSLTVNFGDIAANEMHVALWEIESSIKGEFIDYSASFDVINPLGDPDLSIVKEVRIHEIVRVDVEVEGMDDNCTVLFLMDDEVDGEVQYPETLYSSIDLQQFAVELGQVQDVVIIPTNNGSDEGATSFVMNVSRHTFDISDAKSSWLYFKYVDTNGLLNADLTVFNVTKHESDSNTDNDPYLDPRHVWITTDEDDSIVVNVIDPQGISGEALYSINPNVVPTSPPSTSISTTSPTSTPSQSPTPTISTSSTPTPTTILSSMPTTPSPTPTTPSPSSTPDCFDPLADYVCIE